MITPEEEKMYKSLFALGVAGLIAGLGTLLASAETLTLRIIIGRAMSSFALGIAAASVLTWMPSLAFEAQVGLSCLVASLGTSGLEKLIQRVIAK